MYHDQYHSIANSKGEYRGDLAHIDSVYDGREFGGCVARRCFDDCGVRCAYSDKLKDAFETHFIVIDCFAYGFFKRSDTSCRPADSLYRVLLYHLPDLR